MKLCYERRFPSAYDACVLTVELQLDKRLVDSVKEESNTPHFEASRAICVCELTCILGKMDSTPVMLPLQANTTSLS